MGGKKKLEEIRNGELVEAQKKAAESGLPEDAQRAKDIAAQCDRLEKKLYDLELSKTIALQTGPQIRMVQQNDQEMARSLYTSSTDTISLWKRRVIKNGGY